MKDKFSSNLRRLRRERKLTLEALAEDVNKKYGTKINKGMISKWENGEKISLKLVKILSLYFNLTLNELLGFNEEVVKKNKIPILKSVKSMGSENNIITYALKPPLLKLEKFKELFYYRVNCDLVDKILPLGSMALIEKTFLIKNDDIVLLLLNNEKEVFYKVKLKNDYLFLFPDSTNPHYQTKVININWDAYKIIGRVVSVAVIK